MKSRVITTTEFWLGVAAALTMGFLSCTALVAIAPIFDSSGTTYSLNTELPSTTSESRAILYTGMGGGAAGWCYQRLAIVPAGTPFEPEQLDSDLGYVFSASCGSRVSSRWLSPRELEVSYSLDSAAGTTLYQRPFTRDGHVRLSFVPTR